MHKAFLKWFWILSLISGLYSCGKPTSNSECVRTIVGTFDSIKMVNWLNITPNILFDSTNGRALLVSCLIEPVFSDSEVLLGNCVNPKYETQYDPFVVDSIVLSDSVYINESFKTDVIKDPHIEIAGGAECLISYKCMFASDSQTLKKKINAKIHITTGNCYYGRYKSTTRKMIQNAMISY